MSGLRSVCCGSTRISTVTRPKLRIPAQSMACRWPVCWGVATSAFLGWAYVGRSLTRFIRSFSGRAPGSRRRRRCPTSGWRRRSSLPGRRRGGSRCRCLVAGPEFTVLGLMGLELGGDAGNLRLALAVVPTGLGGVVPGSEVTKEAVSLLLGVHVVDLVLALFGGLLNLRHGLVEKSHDVLRSGDDDDAVAAGSQGPDQRSKYGPTAPRMRAGPLVGAISARPSHRPASGRAIRSRRPSPGPSPARGCCRPSIGADPRSGYR